MQLLINQTTDITTNSYRHFGGKITFQCGGVYGGAQVALYQSIDGAHWDIIATFVSGSNGTLTIPFLNQAIFQAHQTGSTGTTKLSLSGG